MEKLLDLTATGVCLALFITCPPYLVVADATSEVAPIVAEFKKQAEKYKVPVPKLKDTKFYFLKTLDKEYGICYTKFNEIGLNPKDWKYLSPEEKEDLVFHEIGHCVLGKEHTKNNVGIMKATGLHDSKYYRQNRDLLIAHFFNVQYKEKAVTKAEIMNNKHAVVRFTATWCPPCKVLAPVFDEVAGRYPDVKTYVIDVDQYQDLAREFGIRGIPTLIQVKNNNIEATIVGAQPKEKVEELFK